MSDDRRRKVLIIPEDYYPKRFTKKCGCYRQVDSYMATSAIFCRKHAKLDLYYNLIQ